ncbi:hypothetical protein N7495_004623, partial [Penicillium taxi]|uniref:uncharacterized protein n=1 Tax=Penicillium taxi TaxID=168475 RepID=UPI0025451F62
TRCSTHILVLDVTMFSPSTLFILLASTASIVSSQNTTATSYIDPDSVSLPVRREYFCQILTQKLELNADFLQESWCASQISTCPLLCLQLPGSDGSKVNNCTAETLDYSCICSNGASPNASQYSLTIPYFTCTEAGTQCVNNCGGDSTCQGACRTDHPCGAQNPKRVNVTTTTSAAPTASTTVSSVISTTEATGAAPRRMPFENGQVYGLCVLVGGFIAGFAVLL